MTAQSMYDIINTIKEPEEIRPLLKGYKGKICTIDAKTISLETLGAYFPNTPPPLRIF